MATSLPAREKAELRSRDDVFVKALTLDGALELIELWEKQNLQMPRSMLTLEVAQALFPEDRATQAAAMEASEKLREDTIRQWLRSQRVLWPPLIRNVTDLTDAEVGKLPIPDAFSILAQAIKLLDLNMLLEVARAFFTALGGLGEGLKQAAPPEVVAAINGSNGSTTGISS